jgi:hypothetical protein
MKVNRRRRAAAAFGLLSALHWMLHVTVAGKSSLLRRPRGDSGQKESNRMTWVWSRWWIAFAAFFVARGNRGLVK